MKREVVWTSKFKKDYKLSMKRHFPIEELDKVITMLANDEILPETYRDHELSGNWKGFRECHIQSNWLLIYAISNNRLVLSLTRTGTHSDLFNL